MRAQVRKIVAWHPVLTDHQAYTYAELQRQSGLPVIVKVAKLEDETRRAQGWSDTQVDSIERQLIPSSGFLRSCLRYLFENRHQIHLFGSAFEKPRLTLLLWITTLLRIECYVISEPYSPVPFGYFGDQAKWLDQIKAYLRPHIYRCYALGLRSGLKGVFTISRLAAKQYEDAGIPPNKLFPFGYFVPSEVSTDIDIQDTTSRSKRGYLRIVFVGSLIPRKGLPTLINAVRYANEQGCDIQLDVYGPGDPSGYDFDEYRVRYSGLIAFGDTQKHLLGYDLLVLPSHYDGWGVVVNEALCADVPVLCSDQVGARVLVETFGVGLVFPRGNERALAKQFFEMQKNPSRLQEMKSACSKASEAIQPSNAAAYMLQVLSTEPDLRAGVPSPWYRAN